MRCRISVGVSGISEVSGCEAETGLFLCLGTSDLRVSGIDVWDIE